MTNQPYDSDVILIGAGAGNLACAMTLAHAGLKVIVLEQNAHVGGKVQLEGAGHKSVSMGPTVLTMPWVFRQLFANIGKNLDTLLSLQPLSTIARHFWQDGTVFDLTMDFKQTYDAVAQLGGQQEAKGYQQFCDYSKHIYQAVAAPFLYNERPSSWQMLKNGSKSWQLLQQIDPFRTMHQALRHFFTTPKMRQLFGRYSTYIGGSPYQTPATLLLIAHVERLGVFVLPQGLSSLMTCMATCAQQLGATLSCNQRVDRLLIQNHQVLGVILTDGRTLRARSTVVNGGPETIAALTSAKPIHQKDGLSALVWGLVGQIQGQKLSTHNIFFSNNDAAEFAALFQQRLLPQEPSVYMYAPKDEASTQQSYTCLLNAPADGKRYSHCTSRLFHALARFGLFTNDCQSLGFRSPYCFAQRFPGSQGALYGPTPHGWLSFFRRYGSRHRLRQLYLCGGSVHPGAGVPLATLSGQLAAKAVLTDLAKNGNCV